MNLMCMLYLQIEMKNAGCDFAWIVALSYHLLVSFNPVHLMPDICCMQGSKGPEQECAEAHVQEL